jgi:hypothetical protein
VLRHPWIGAAACSAGDRYRDGLPQRFAQQADALADLTGWKVADIRIRMEATGQSFSSGAAGLGPFLRRLFD